MIAKEFRIGNLVNVCNLSHNDLKDIPLEITGVKLRNEPLFPDCKSAMSFIHPRYEWEISQFDKFIKPIQLTEEWLLKFGFLRHHLDYSNGVIYIKNVPGTNEFEWGVFPNELGSGIQVKNRIKLKYVHQLQNLHFALTGKELEYENS
jgi:hypothetical protein